MNDIENFGESETNANDNDIFSDLFGTQRKDLIVDMEIASGVAPTGFQPVSIDIDHIVPDQSDAQSEYENIILEVTIGSRVRERAFYRIWRLRNTGLWTEIVGLGGDKYQSWEAFIRDIASNDIFGIGRQAIYDRMKVYDQLQWLGYTDAEIIVKVSAKPSLYNRVLNKLVDWDTTNKTPNAIMLPSSDNLTADEAKIELRKLIEDTEQFPQQIDALRYIDEQILFVPTVKYYMQNDAIIVEYVRSSIDQNGNVVIEDEGIIKMYPDQHIPDWVLHVLQSKIK